MSQKTGTQTTPRRILFATSEALPYFKSGGLADVSRSLPDALSNRGHHVRIIHPLYSTIDRLRVRPRKVGHLTIPWVTGNASLELLLHEPKEGAPALLVGHPAFAIERSPYEDSNPHAVGQRFALFARAVLHYARSWGADLIHLNDWQTGLVPAYGLVDGISIPTLFTIHNLAYQGIFAPWIMDAIGLPRELFRTENGVEFFNNVSYLKSGLALSSRISTVSPTYAREIQTPEYGAGFDGLLRFRSRDLFGILNGIDTKVWNPVDDHALPKTYDLNSLANKDESRSLLVREANLEPDRPLFAVVSRLAHQKGIDLILGGIGELMDAGINLVILGNGDAELETAFAEVARRFPTRVAAVSRFDDTLAHRLYAGADFFLMPSRYEPCGLGQMIAQRFGTPPVVRATGGLRDTVIDGQTGFLFERASVPDLVDGVQRALAVWRGPKWDLLRRNCMKLDWSWGASAQHYEEAYASALGPAHVDRNA